MIPGPPPSDFGQIKVAMPGSGPAIAGSVTGDLMTGPSQGFIAGSDPIFNETAGVYGQSNQAGVFGNSDAAGGTGVHARGGGANGYGVRAEITGAGQAAVSGHVYGDGPALAGQFIGNVDVTGDIRLVNGDVAEDFSTRVDIEAGSVVVLGADALLEACTQPYDARLVGVVSGAGSFKPAVVLDRHADGPHRRAPIALIGKVYCKVDAAFGAIRVGDLLTTSATPGHAMRAGDLTRCTGAIVGKAMQSHERGVGLIPIFVTPH